MLDAYLSENIYKVNDDTQEFEKRYLAIQYSGNIYDYNDLAIKLGSLIRYDTERIKEFSGLQNVIDNYINKHCQHRQLSDKDPDKIVNAYLGKDYKRKKNCYFTLKDLGYTIRTMKPKVDPTKTSIQLAEEDRNLLCYLVDMTLDDLKQYVAMQEREGMHR